MTSSKNGLAKIEKESPVNPAARFASDFSRLIADVDKLVLVVHGTSNGNGHANKSRPNGNGYLHKQARSFFDVNFAPLATTGLEPLWELVASLSGPREVSSVGDAVRKYCAAVFQSPAGFIFLAKDGNLVPAYRWQSHHIVHKAPRESAIIAGPALQVLRSGKPVFCYRRKTNSRLGDYLRLFTRCGTTSASFLPLVDTDRRTIGVLALAFPQMEEFPLQLRQQLSRLAQVLTDSIARVLAYEEAVSARVEAETAVKKQDEFLSSLSHELKNPMTPILGWAVALSSGTLPPERQNLALDVIVRNVRALNYLIHDMFDAVRISSGKFHLEPSEMRIQEVAREALTVIQGTAEGKKLRIATEISEAVPPFNADPQRLRQVLLNLLNNAVKFTPPGGAISLKVNRHGNKVECLVSDTGRGIHPKFLPFVFDRFRQEARGGKNRSGGMGLGLAIAHEIVALHGGTVSAQSKGIDKGATFIVQLPLRRSKA